MPKLTPVSYKILVKIFESLGYVKARQKGSHISMVKSGSPRPIIVPAHAEVSIGVIQSCLRTAGIDRDEYFNLLDKYS